MDDTRYNQIDTETTQEANAQKSKYAFTGFGRSTDLGTSVDKVLAEAQKRKAQLAAVISIEQMIDDTMKAGGEVGKGMYEALSSAKGELARLAQQAQQRRAKVSQELMTAGQSEGNKQNAKLRYRTSFKTKGYKASGRIKQLKASHKSIQRTKTLSSTKGFAPLKSLGQITAKGRSKHFGEQKTLSNHNA